jgi:periplasmic protein TonB
VRLRTIVAWITLLVSLVPRADSQIPPAQTAPPESAEQEKSKEGGGTGGEVYKVGRGVTPPRAIYSPDPQYSKKARKAKFQGTCVLWLVVGADGKPRNIRVQRTLGMGLDEEAIKAVEKWKFEPARKDGQPVAVQINVEVTFRLY